MALNLKGKKIEHTLLRRNILIELASDLLSETLDRAAEVLHYLSCQSLNGSFSFILALLSPAGEFIFSRQYPADSRIGGMKEFTMNVSETWAVL